MGVREEGYQYSKAYKMGLTDGYTDFHEKTPLGFKVPSGLTDMLIEVLGEWQNQQYFEFTYMDNRPDPILLSSDVKFPIQVGEKTLRDYQEEAVIASLDNLTGIIKHSTNCVTGDTILYTDKGLKTFDDVILENDIDTSQKEVEKPNTNGLKVLNRYGEIEEPSHLMYNGIRDTYEIKLDNGNSIKATKEHPLMVVNTLGEFEWKKVNDIIEGDYIVGLRDSVLDTKTKLPEDEKYTFNKVTSKEYYGKEKTYDLHVPGTHSFIANGIINHNSGKTSSALGLIQELLPYTEKDERIAFFTESTAIFNQVYNEFSETLDVPVGRWGAGKKDIKKVTVVMVQTIYAGVKADPEKGLKLTPKQRIQKKMTKEILPIIQNTVNPKLVLQNFVSTFKVKTKADQDFLDEINEVIKKSESGAKAKFHVNKYGAEYQKIVKKKAEKVYKKHKEAMDFLDSLVGFIVDECLVEDTLITKLDGTQDSIQNFKVGDEIVGGVIEDIKVTEKETIKIEHENGHISGSLTHPTYVVKADGDGETKILPFIAIEVGDYLVNYEHGKGYTFSKVTNITETGKQTVYDFTTSTHTFIANNTLTANCHHTKSDSFYKTFLHAENAIYRIGLTGSIDQNDPMLVQRLRATFSKVISETRNSQMIERGISAKPTIYFSTIEHVLNDIEEELPNGEVEVIKNEPVDISLNKNYMDSYDKGIVKNNYRNTVIAKIAEINYNKGRGVLIILNRIEHGDIISHMLDTLEIPHAFVQGEMEVEEREKHFTDMKQGKLKVLISTSLMDEGVDISGIDALIMGAGGKSLRQVLQRIGRGLRYKDDGENKLYVYDFTDRVNDYLFTHYKQRREIYQEEEFDIVDL